MLPLPGPNAPSYGRRAHFAAAEDEGGDEMDRDELLRQLGRLGFQTDVLQDLDDAVLSEILRVVSSKEDEDEDEDEAPPDEAPLSEEEQDDEDAALDALPEAKNAREREQYAERGRAWMRRGRRVLEKYADDRSSAGGGGGLLGSGVSKDTTPHWSMAKYKEVFAENERGLRQLGIDTPEKLRKHRERGKTFCDTGLSRQPAEGRNPLFDSYAEDDVQAAAERFADRRFHRDSKHTGLTRGDYRRLYLDATPAQRQEFCR
jgi:hypothetical protein